MMIAPVESGDNGGRQNDGKFASGNTFAKGNPAHKRVHQLRMDLLDYATKERNARVLRKLYRLACSGDMDAIREWLNRTIGKPKESPENSGDEDTQLETPPRSVLEAAIAERTRNVMQPGTN